MKTTKIILAAFTASLLISSCSSSNDDLNEEIATDKKVAMTIGVGTPSYVESRATVDESGITSGTSTIIWETTDKVKVFSPSNTNGDTFNFYEYGNVQQNAYFKGYCEPSTTGWDVVYPASAGISYNTTYSAVEVKVPETQDATPDSFDPKAMVQTGKVESTADYSSIMQLQNVCAFLYINLCEGCTSVTVEDNDESVEYALAGTVYVKSESSGSTIDATTGWKHREPIVTLNNPSGAAGKYLICVIPSGQYPGLKVTVWKGTTQYKTLAQGDATKTVNLQAGKLYSLGQVKDENWKTK